MTSYREIPTTTATAAIAAIRPQERAFDPVCRERKGRRGSDRMDVASKKETAFYAGAP